MVALSISQYPGRERTSVGCNERRESFYEPYVDCSDTAGSTLVDWLGHADRAGPDVKAPQPAQTSTNARTP